MIPQSHRMSGRRSCWRADCVFKSKIFSFQLRAPVPSQLVPAATYSAAGVIDLTAFPLITWLPVWKRELRARPRLHPLSGCSDFTLLEHLLMLCTSAQFTTYSALFNSDYFVCTFCSHKHARDSWLAPVFPQMTAVFFSAGLSELIDPQTAALSWIYSCVQKPAVCTLIYTWHCRNAILWTRRGA